MRKETKNELNSRITRMDYASQKDARIIRELTMRCDDLAYRLKRAEATIEKVRELWRSDRLCAEYQEDTDAFNALFEPKS